MASNVTLRMDEDLLREVKHRAVDDRMSVSAWVAALLRRTVGGGTPVGWADAPAASNVRKRALDRLEKGWSLGGRPLTREQAHGR
jgi:hypothetical protein